MQNKRRDKSKETPKGDKRSLHPGSVVELGYG
jgi:hypothetical protein